MFSSSQGKESEELKAGDNVILDPLTKWLIRITCLVIILFFSGILLGIPVIISFAKSQLNNSILNFKDILKTLLEPSLM